jgi:hypothetical protein
MLVNIKGFKGFVAVHPLIACNNVYSTTLPGPGNSIDAFQEPTTISN